MLVPLARVHSAPAALRRALLSAIAVCVPTVAAAQQPDTAARDPVSAPWRVGVFAGAAHDSPINAKLGVTPGRDHLFLGLEALTPILRVGGMRLSYAAQLLPLVVVRGRSAPRDYAGVVDAAGLLPGPNVAYAVGMSPFGFELRAPIAGAVELFGAAAAGGLQFTRPFPVPEAQRFNFTLEYGGGVLVRLPSQRVLQLGYKYHHLSNAYTAHVNPGLDANVFYAGYQWSVRLAR